MKKYIFILLTVVFIGGMWGTAMADSQMYHGSGIIQVPNTDVLTRGQLDIGFYYTGRSPQLILSAGVIDNLEVGFGVGESRKGGPFTALAMKVRLIPETGDYPGVSMGVQNDSLYVVAGKRLDFMKGLRGYIGAMVGNNSGPFIGFERALNPIQVTSTDSNGFNVPPATVLVELSTRGLSGGMRFSITPDFTMEIILADMSKVVVGGTFSMDF